MPSLTFINHAADQAEEWISEIQNELELPRKESAYAALRAVLHCLRQRIPLKESAHLSAQLPTLIRGIYFEGWTGQASDSPARTEEEFINGVMEVLKPHREIHAAKAVHAVFSLLDRKVTPGEINDLISNFPFAMRGLWPDQAVARLGANEGR